MCYSVKVENSWPPAALEEEASSRTDPPAREPGPASDSSPPTGRLWWTPWEGLKYKAMRQQRTEVNEKWEWAEALRCDKCSCSEICVLQDE